MISFVVPAHDEASLLPATLTSLHEAARATGIAYEIVVVDDDSTDGTAAIAGAHQAMVVGVQVRHIAAARNAGARAATGDRLVFVDADTLVPPATLAATLAVLDDGAVGGGALMQLDGAIPWHGRLLAAMVTTSMRLASLAAGCYLFSTRAAFEAAGGFDERLYATEEIALSRALHRLGRFVVLRERVQTSGRKLRTHSSSEIARQIGRVLVLGPRALRTRAHLDLWYGERRTDR